MDRPGAPMANAAHSPPLRADGPALELRGVSVDFGDRSALRAVSLSVERGAAVALVGPSGAGKTTLLRCLAGAQRPSAGAVYVAGADLYARAPSALRREQARVGFVHQDLALVPVLRVAQNVLAGRLGRFGTLRGLARVLAPRRAALAEVHRLLERLGIADQLFQRTDRLSGGQQQRVALARALYQEPTLLLADEPVASVDPERARDVIVLLTRLAREEGLTLVASLHDVELAREHFPRIVGLRGGVVQFDTAHGSAAGAALASPFHAAAASALYALDAAPPPDAQPHASDCEGARE